MERKQYGDEEFIYAMTLMELQELKNRKEPSEEEKQEDDGK